MLGLWDGFMAHVNAWTAKRSVSSALSKGVYQKIKLRFKAQYSPAHAAAYLVDPRNFVEVSFLGHLEEECMLAMLIFKLLQIFCICSENLLGSAFSAVFCALI